MSNRKLSVKRFNCFAKCTIAWNGSTVNVQLTSAASARVPGSSVVSRLTLVLTIFSVSSSSARLMTIACQDRLDYKQIRTLHVVCLTDSQNCNVRIPLLFDCALAMNGIA